MNRPEPIDQPVQPAPSATYAAARSATHRPTLNLRTLRDGRQHPLQLSWIGLVRSARR